MKQTILTQFPWTWLPITALVIFFVFFVGLFVVTHFRSKTPIYSRAAELALEEGQNGEELNNVG